nr:hypothetical protein [Tanacetum cinerariifolium]
MSRKSAQNMSCNAEVTYSKGKVHPSDDGSQPERYVSTDFVMSDAKSLTFKCRVKIDDTRSQKEWNFLSCDGEKCKKGVVRKNGRFWCQVCKKAIDYPVLREELKDSHESTGDMDDGRVDGKKSSLTDKRKKKRYIVDDCDSA